MNGQMDDSSVSNSKAGAHTPEPWVCYSHRGTIIDPSAATIALVGDFTVARDGQSYEFHGSDEQDACRIVACVNACAGIATAELEEEGKDALDLAANIKEMVQQRDELAEALREVLEACRPGGRKTEWSGSIRCPNPSVDGPKFARAEALLAKIDTDSTK